MSFVSEFKSQFLCWRKSEIAWLVFSTSSIAAISLSLDERPLSFCAAITGMLFTVFAGKGKSLCYLFGLVNTPIYAYLSYIQGFYGDMALNVYYFVMMFPGLVCWYRHKSSDAFIGVKRVSLSRVERVAWFVSLTLATFALWAVLSFLGGSRPFCDSLTNVLSVGAMILTVKRAIEQWVLWITVNAVEVFMWWNVYLAEGGSVSILLMWVLFLANGIYLFKLWLKTGVEGRQVPGIGVGGVQGVKCC
jgi:nicotinamide mononucleotide transporter